MPDSTWVRNKAAFLAATIAVMYVLHGNSRQFWPRIPYLSLRDESIPEHRRLLFNTLLLVTLGQVAAGRLPRARLAARSVSLGLVPILLPLLLGAGHRMLHLHGRAALVYHISLVPALPLVAALLEDGLVCIINRVDQID